MNMDINKFKLFQRNKFEDERGLISEVFKISEFGEFNEKNLTFVQENLVISKQNSLRGLHYQSSPKMQGKFISVIMGEIFDVIVDIRSNSRNFSRSYCFTLSSDNQKSLWVPPGFAHGFLTISEKSIVSYKLTEYYSLEHSRSIKWNSPKLDIPWPNKINIILSDKDKNAKEFDETEIYA